METRLANAWLTLVQRPDPEASYHKMPFDSLGALTPARSWSRLFDGLGIADRGPVNVGQPAFMKELDAMMTSVSIPDWRIYLRRRLVNTAGDLLSTAFVNENFEFDGRILTGATAPRRLDDDDLHPRPQPGRPRREEPARRDEVIRAGGSDGRLPGGLRGRFRDTGARRRDVSCYAAERRGGEVAAHHDDGTLAMPVKSALRRPDRTVHLVTLGCIHGVRRTWELGTVKGSSAQTWRRKMQCTRLLLVAFVGALPFAAAVVTADDTVQIAPGTRLRVTVPTGGGRLIGSLLALDDKSLTLQVAGQTDRKVVRREDITKIAVSAGRRSRGKGALLGAGFGAGAGAVIGLAAGDDKEGFIQFSAGQKALLVAVLLTPVGALIGLAGSPAERWKEVPTDRIRLSLTPVRGRGAAVSLTFSF